MADFTDMFSNYLSNRVDNATQPFTDPSTYMQNRLYGDVGMAPPGETEEERRRRLEKEAKDRANEEIQTQTVKTYADGSKEHISTTQEPAPVAPIQPVPQPAPVQEAPQPVPQPAPVQEAPQPVPQPAPVQEAPPPVAAPIAPPQMAPAVAPPPAQAQPIINDQGQVLGRETPAQMVQGAQTNAPIAQAPQPQGPVAPPAMTPAVAPVAQGPVNPAAPAPTPAAAPVVTQPPAEPPAPDWEQKLSNAKTPDEVLNLLSDPNTPKDVRGHAAEQYAGLLANTGKEKSAEKTLMDASKGDPRATSELARELKKSGEEGSYLKAIFFARMGLTELAKEEQQKLGAGTQYQSVVGPDNKRYTAVVNGQGAVTKAFDAAGNIVNDQTLTSINAQGAYQKGAVTGQTFGKDAQGNVISHRILPNGGGVQWKNETSGELLSSAPIGYHSMGQKSLEQLQAEKGISTAASVETKMRKANTDAALMGIPAPFTEQQISAAKNQATTSSVAAGFTNPSIKIISATRPTTQQQAMWDESVRSGREGFTAEGNPIARPGTSLHETGNALDIDNNALNAAGRKELIQKGYYQPIPQRDPNHWEKLEPETPAAASNPATTRAPVAGAAPSMAQKIANYEMKPPQSRSAMYGPLMQEVSRLNPGYDETKYATVQDARKKFTTGKQGDTVRSMNVAIDHLDTLKEAGDALRNGDMPLFNKIANQYSQNTGSEIVTNFDGIKSIVGSEVAKAVSGGQMALQDRDEIRKELSAANSPEQLNGVIKKFQQLLGGQLKGLKTQYEDAGLKDFDHKLTDRTKRVLGEGGNQPKQQSRSNW